MNNKTQVAKDFAAKTVTVSREFNAPVNEVWRAYTEADLLDQWWGPAPWRAETKFMNFNDGGYWLYAMVGPNGERHWGRMNYIRIKRHSSIEIEDVFCDESGNVNNDLPVSTGAISFTATAEGTLVEFRMTYPTESDLQKIVEMGFETGITLCLDQLELLLSNKVFSHS